jgi:hypothetical protein
MSCLEAGHILPNGLKKTFFIFLLSQRQSNLKYRNKLDFRNAAKTPRVHSSWVKIQKRFENSSTWPTSIRTNSHELFSTLSMGMPCSLVTVEMVHRFLFTKTHSRHNQLRPFANQNSLEHKLLFHKKPP